VQQGGDAALAAGLRALEAPQDRMSCDGLLLGGRNSRTALSNVISPALSCWWSTR
jgi:hypothetical protein